MVNRLAERAVFVLLVEKVVHALGSAEVIAVVETDRRGLGDEYTTVVALKLLLDLLEHGAS